MGKRGKAARKRRRENEIDTATLASKLVKRSTGATADYQDDGGRTSDPDNKMMGTTGQHEISDAALDMTVATLHRLSGLVDPATGKLALKDKRYRSLRKVLYELQSSSTGVQSSTTLSSSNSNNGVGSLLSSENNDAPHPISTSKITREISAQIENGAWEIAVTTLRHVRKKQEEYSKHTNNTTAEKGTGADASYLRPKLGSVQRWVRQIDAAGTGDPLALGVLDAILRVVAPDAILPVDKADVEKATWARLGVSSLSSDINGKDCESESVRLFPPFDRRKDDIFDKDDILSKPQSEHNDIVDTLVSCMQAGEDGIRRISSPQLKEHRDTLFRQCGYEKGGDRKPPNKYDLELVTTAAAIAETNTTIESSNLTSNVDTTFSGKDILLDNSKGHPVIKTPLPYVRDSFFLENVLSPMECNRLIAAAEAAGYRPDEPLAGQPGESILAHACVWIVDHKLERTIFERVKKFLPSYEQSKQEQGGSGHVGETLQPLGLNCRFRFYRYVPGRYYRPHIDGAWPASGFDRKGNYRYDVYDEANKNGLQFVENGGEESVEKEDSSKQPENNRRQMSRLTFLIYLNDDFDGGTTTFLIPAKEKEGTLNAFPVKPVCGGILVFPHGICAAPLHEGSPVLNRCKYVVRTEVEYYT